MNEAKDDLGILRDAEGLSERCEELRMRLVVQGKRVAALEAERDALLEALRTYRKATRWGWRGFCPVCEFTEDDGQYEHEGDCVVRKVEQP